MKWGVRKKHYSTNHDKFMGQSRDSDIHIKSGTEAQRVSSKKNVDNKQTYVSLDRLDHMEYLKFAAGGEGGIAVDAVDGNMNSLRMIFTKDIIAPSYQQTMTSFCKTLSSFKPKALTADLGLNKQRGKEFIKQCKNLDKDEMIDKAYLTFCGTMLRDTKAKKIFFDDLKRKGYNAIIDENDAKYGEDGDMHSALLVFDGSNLKVNKAVTLSERDKEYLSDTLWNGEGDTHRFKNESRKWDKYAKSTKYREMYDW